MNKKILIAVIVSLAVSSFSALHAQKVDYKVVGFETSVLYSYDFNGATVGFGYSAGITLPLSAAFAANFSFTNGGGSLNDMVMLGLNYGIMDKMGVMIGFGQDTTAVVSIVSLGMYYNVFQRKVQDGMNSLLKLRVNYTFAPTNGFETGDIVLALSLGFGI